MADPISSDTIAQLLQGKSPAEAQQFLDQINGAFKKYGIEHNVILKSIVDGTNQGAKDIARSVNDGVKDVSKAIQDFSIDGLVEECDAAFTKLGISGKSLVKFGETVATIGLSVVALNNLPPSKIFTNLSQQADQFGRVTSSMTEGVGAFIHVLGLKPEDNTTKVLQSMAAASDEITGAEQAMIQTAAASGQLNLLLDKTGDSFQNIEKSVNEFQKISVDAARATGLNTEQTSQYANMLNHIPGALDANIEANAKGTTSLHSLDAALKVATGSGLGFGATFDEISSMYGKFGEEGGKGVQNTLQYISRLSEATSNLGIPLEYVRNFTDQAADSFKFFGNNSEAAINIISRMGPALKASGLGPEAIRSMLGDMTSNLNNMSLGQRSFLSSQTGGPGGLRGGYQIDLLKSQGKIDEVEKMAEQALRKQFGGRVVTLAEGARDEGSARQLAKQVQLATTGPTKLVNTEAEAYKLFDAMNSGKLGEASALKSPQNSLEEAVKRGTDIEVKNTNIFANLVTEASESSASLKLIVRNTGRGFFGAGEGRNEKSQLLSEQMVRGSVDAAKSKMYGEGGRKQTDVTQDLISLRDKLGSGVVNDLMSGKINLKGDLNSGISYFNKYMNIDDESNPVINAFKDRNDTGVKKLMTLDEANNPKQQQQQQQKQDKTNQQNITVHVPVSIDGKQIQDIVVKVVNGKIQDMDRGGIAHNHIGANIRK